ncbi:MAG: biotin/lipoyl-binding protein [Candidatus Heimdallarchaeota archaeon]|nr:biotin/lipoyl-binding protein [Candidatus Heimdallarchaeota archaeon]
MFNNKYKVMLNGSELELENTEDGIKIGEITYRPKVIMNDNVYQVFIGNQEYKIEHRKEGLFLNGKEIDFDFRIAPKILAKKQTGSARGAEIKAAIPGKIAEIIVKVGEKVKDQQCLLILESMKMRNEILSPIDGIVESILVSEGEQVKARQLLIKLQAPNYQKKELE